MTSTASGSPSCARHGPGGTAEAAEGAQNAWWGVQEPCTSRNRATISPTVA